MCLRTMAVVAAYLDSGLAVGAVYAGRAQLAGGDGVHLRFFHRLNALHLLGRGLQFGNNTAFNHLGGNFCRKLMAVDKHLVALLLDGGYRCGRRGDLEVVRDEGFFDFKQSLKVVKGDVPF